MGRLMPEPPQPAATAGSVMQAARRGGHTGSQGVRAPGQAAHAGGNASGSANEPNSTVPVAAAANQMSGHSRQEETAVFLLMLFNPTTLSAFTLWFGACGLFAWRLLQFLPIQFTVPIALAGGFFGTMLTLHLMGVLARSLSSSSSFSQASLIGLQAEVTVPVQAGKTGEITCVAGGPRYTCSARTLQSDTIFKRGAQVIICDMRDDIAYVEPWPDNLESFEPLDSQELLLDPPLSLDKQQPPG
jgi:hypothetical protein